MNFVLWVQGSDCNSVLGVTSGVTWLCKSEVTDACLCEIGTLASR